MSKLTFPIPANTPFRLIQGIGDSKKFKKGVIVASKNIIQREGHDISNIYIFDDPKKTAYSGWSYISAYDNRIELLSKEEIENMSKPQPILARNTVTGITYFYSTVEAASKDISKKLQADPTQVYNVYELKGALKAKEIPVDFVASSLLT